MALRRPSMMDSMFSVHAALEAERLRSGSYFEGRSIRSRSVRSFASDIDGRSLRSHRSFISEYELPQFSSDNEPLLYEEDEGKFTTEEPSLLVTVCILMIEMCERLTFYSTIAGLVLYCTSNLGIDQTDATLLNQIFVGFCYMTPVVGGIVSDSFIGRFKTILMATTLYIIGSMCLTASAIDWLSWGVPLDLTQDQRTILYLSGLGCIAVGTGGIKANVAPFGAEQIAHKGPEAIQSFFNWFYWLLGLGALFAYTVVAYIQQEISFYIGFAIPTVTTIICLFIYICARKKYIRSQPQGSVLSLAFGIVRQGACKPKPPPNPDLPVGAEKELLCNSKRSYGGSYSDHLVEGVASVIKVLPFCLFVILYGTLYSQMANTFFAQAERMDIRLTPTFNIPAAALNAFETLSIIILIPVVDKFIFPCFEKIGKPLTYLKRMAIGLLFEAAGVGLAGVVEIYRKIELNEPGGSHIQDLAGQNFTASNMSVFWQIPQFSLIGASEIFCCVTCLEFAYNQAPVAMQGLLTGVFLMASGSGNWLSSALFIIIEAATANDPWWGSEINDCKMENLMFLLAGIMVVNVIFFTFAAHHYTYVDPASFEEQVLVIEVGGGEDDYIKSSYNNEETNDYATFVYSNEPGAPRDPPPKFRDQRYDSFDIDLEAQTPQQRGVRLNTAINPNLRVVPVESADEHTPLKLSGI